MALTAKQQERRKRYEEALQNSGVQQMLNGIGHRESGNRYNVRYSGEPSGAKFDMSQPGGHPGIPALRKDGRASTAAGRYMFTKPTWNDAAKALGLDNFNDPKQQDLAAAWLLDQTKSGGKTGLQYALSGDLLGASKAASQRWEAISRLTPQKFAAELPNYRAVALGTAAQQPQPAVQQAAQQVADTQHLGRIGTAEGEGIPYGPPSDGTFGYVTQPNYQAGADNFRAAIDRAHQAVDQRLIPGTPESFTVHPLRRMMADLGWGLDEPRGSAAPLGFNRAMEQGVTPQSWEANMRDYFGASKTSPVMDQFTQMQEQPPAPVTDKSWQQLVNPLTAAKQEAMGKMFGKEQLTEDVNWPPGLNASIDNAIEETWNHG